MFDGDTAMTPVEGAPQAVQAADQGTMTSMAREAIEAKSMVEAAKMFPRNESQAFVDLGRSMGRVALAERAAYSFPRGGARVTGPSVVLAREAARVWGNVTYGVRVVQVDENYIHIQGWAWDLQTNTRTVAEDKFEKLIQRKRGGVTEWVKPDERDLRELVNRRGALCVRNAILQILPKDLVDDALDMATKTLQGNSESRLQTDRAETVKGLVKAFDALSVTVSMIEGKLGHPVSEVDAEELTELRQIYRSMKDGSTKRTHHFATKAEGKSKAQELQEELDANQEPGEVEH